MIIGIDGNEANVSRKVGIGEYAYQILSGFRKFQDPDLGFRIFLKTKPVFDFVADKNWSYSVFGPRPLWTQLALPFHLFMERKRPDIFFSPSHYAPRLSPVPTAIAIMDLSYEFYPEYFRKKDLLQLRNWTRYSAKRSSLIFTISIASKRDIMLLYDIPEEQIIVTYPGIKPFVSLSPHVYTKSMLEKFKITKPYFLFVGTLQPRKNIVRLIEGFSLLLSKTEKKDTELVIVGKKGWLFEEILKAPQKYGVEESVKFLDYVTDEDLPTLYKHAIGYILPSLYEGFGLPILEAMQHGCPVITSNVSSLPEAGGDAALYVNPLDAEDIASKMRDLLENEGLRKKLIEKGKKHSMKFSWEKTAAQTLAALELLVKKQ